ncbi:MAG: small, acid-soluble spore protein, alpha/beta type [Lachnospiraceae bacterium]|nr:small, acid-soluble spore protein, alpha/beta type [Lachnospiraceae bacterium]
MEIVAILRTKELFQEVVMKKRKPIVLSEVKPEEMRKYEIAKELGLLDKVLSEGWQSLSAKETGKIGGMLSRQAREAKNGQQGK